jgi:histidine triad (HIT) family protein
MSDCIFCKIIEGSIPSKKLFEDAEALAFWDIDPKAPVHFLVIPKRHIANVMELGPDDDALMGRLMRRAQELARAQGLGEKGARFVVNCKSDGGQTVDHLHIHVLGGRAMRWPPG